MDPSKSPTAPPMNYGPIPPPAYHDTGYPPQPGMGYPPQPGTGYPPQPGMGYPPQPGTGYPPQPQGFGAPPPYGNEGYGQQPYPAGNVYTAQPAAATVHQPAVYVVRGPLPNPVNDYMCYSVFTLMCCCLPLGIAALVYSISTQSANHAGDQLAAERGSRMARKLNHIGLGIGLAFFIIYIVVLAAVVA